MSPVNQTDPTFGRRQTRRRFLQNALGAAIVAGAQLSAARAASREHRWKFAICNETFKDWPQDRAFAFAAECGYRGIEIAPFTLANYVRDITAAQRREIRRLAEQNALEVVGLHWLLANTEGFHLTSPELQVRRKTADYIGELARCSAELGGKLMVFGSPKQRDLLPGVTRAEAMRYGAETLRLALPALEAADVTLALEPLSPTVTTFMTTAADGAELARLVDSPRCRLHLDCLAMSSEPTPISDLIRRHRSLLAHFHVNDTNSQGPGFGTINFVPVLKALRDIDYQGWVSVEVFDYTPGPERLARDSMSHLKRWVAELGRPAGA